MYDDSSRERLGKAGEMVILNWFSQNQMRVEASVDQFDSQKDMVVEGKRVEVKTQVPFVSQNAFSIKKNQLRKCLNADFVYFVSVPNEKRPHFSSGKVYKCDSSRMEYSTYRTKDGRDMIIIPIKQDAMEECFTMSDNECKILQKYSVSGWN